MTDNPIDIHVDTKFIDDQSDPEGKSFVFAYTITIKNQGDTAAKLISRHWQITDGNNKVQEVQGLGVVGNQPRLEPGESFTYTSGVALDTDTGTMEGSYEMQGDDGESYNVTIPAFALVIPGALH